MRLIQSSSLWGNMYRHRYYVNGKRVNKREFESSYAEILLTYQFHNRKMENKVSSFRVIWETV